MAITDPVQMQGYISQQKRLASEAMANAQVNAARQGMLGTVYSQPASFANTLGNIYGSYSQGLGNLGQGMAAGYGGIGNANAMAEAARQGAASNIASSMLANYGSAVGGAYGAWQANQTAYQKALADMYGSNQSAISQLGQSRNNALAGLANAYSQAGTGLGASASVGDLNLDFSSGGTSGSGGGSISANNGDILSGSYGSSYYGSPGMSLTANKSSNNSQLPAVSTATFGGLGTVRGSLDDQAYLDAVREDGAAGMDRLDMQQYTSRELPFQILGGIGQQMTEMGNSGYDESRAGMDQFYGNQYNVLGGLNQTGMQLSSDLSSGYQNATEGVNDLWDRTLGNTTFFQTPLQRRMARQEAIDYSRRVAERRRAEQRARNAAAMAQQSSSGPVGFTPAPGASGRDVSILNALFNR